MGYALTIAVTMIVTAVIVRFVERVKLAALVLCRIKP